MEEKRKAVQAKIDDLAATEEGLGSAETVFDLDGKRRRETSKEKDIRLGVMTAFGTVLKDSTEGGGSSKGDDGEGFRDYLRDQTEGVELKSTTTPKAGLILVHRPFFWPKIKMFTFSGTHSHALTNAKRCHEYLPVPGAFVSFLSFILEGKFGFGTPQTNSIRKFYQTSRTGNICEGKGEYL